MPKTDAAKLPIITFKPFISERGFDLLANAVVEQAVHDYKRLLRRVYVKGEHNPKAWYDTAYYLKHSFTGSTSSLGTLFATGDTSFSRPSSNIAIYGHNIRSKPTVMFSPLLSYK